MTIIKEVRKLTPDRALTWHEARSLSERQATRLLTLADVDAPAVPAQLVSDLRKIEIEQVVEMDASGATTWTRGRWIISLNAQDHPLRQRFSLFHELKHIIDHPYIDRLYGSTSATDQRATAESMCDYFAACVLMPRMWVKRAWVSPIQDVAELAELFGVSRQAMAVRLNQIGLTEPRRCRWNRYERARPPALVLAQLM